jgi:hypothetical protein
MYSRLVKGGPAPTEEPALSSIVEHFRRRLGLEGLARFVMRGSLAGLVLALLTQRLAATIGHELPALVMCSIAITPVVVALALAIVRWPSPRHAARVADRRLALDERLSTALELVCDRARQPAAGLARFQVADAVRAASAASEHWPSPLASVRRELLATLFVVTAGSLLLLDERGAPPPRQAGELSGIASVSNRDVGPTLGELLPGEVSTPDWGGQPHSLRDLDTRQQGEGEVDVPAAALPAGERRAALDRLAEALREVSVGRDIAERIEQADDEGAAELLRQLAEDADQLSAEAKEQLARALHEAAEDTANSDSRLAGLEEQAAQALEDAGYAGQRQALEDLAQALDDAGDPRADAGPASRREGSTQPEGRGQEQGGAGQGEDDGTNGGTGTAGNRFAPRDARAEAPDPDEQAARERAYEPSAERGSPLATTGELVEVPLELQEDGGGVPGGDGAEPGRREDRGSAVVAREDGGLQDPGLVAAEQNVVPDDRREMVRDYFNGAGGDEDER